MQDCTQSVLNVAMAMESTALPGHGGFTEYAQTQQESLSTALTHTLKVTKFCNYSQLIGGKDEGESFRQEGKSLLAAGIMLPNCSRISSKSEDLYA